MKERKFENLYWIKGNLLTKFSKRIVLKEVKQKGKQTKLSAFSDNVEPEGWKVERIFNIKKKFDGGEEVNNSDLPSILRESSFDSKEEAEDFFEMLCQVDELKEENRLAEGVRYLWKFEVEDEGIRRKSKHIISDGKVITLSI